MAATGSLSNAKQGRREPQHFGFEPEEYILNRFDVFTEIPVTPTSLLLAQKFYAIMNRKRSKAATFSMRFFCSRRISNLITAT